MLDRACVTPTVTGTDPSTDGPWSVMPPPGQGLSRALLRQALRTPLPRAAVPHDLDRVPALAFDVALEPDESAVGIPSAGGAAGQTIEPGLIVSRHAEAHPLAAQRRGQDGVEVGGRLRGVEGAAGR